MSHATCRKDHLFTNRGELRVARSFCGMEIGDVVVDDDAPGTRGVDDSAPNLARLPRPVVRGVVLKADDEGHGRAHHGNGEPGQVEPLLVEHLVENDRYQRDENEDDGLLASPSHHVFERVVLLRIHASAGAGVVPRAIERLEKGGRRPLRRSRRNIHQAPGKPSRL